METSHAERWAPQVTPLQAQKTWQARIANAIRRGPRNKATGSDSIFVKALKIDPKQASETIYRFLENYMQLKYKLKDWRTALLVHIYKNGN